jgi:HD-GYP domain-containing protein (c-di-GMP phosphodiesterase class II)
VLIVPIHDVQPGMRLAMTITNPAFPEQELLTAGYPLDEMILKKLRDIGITVLYVDYPDLGDLDRHLEPYLTPARREIYAQVREAFTSVETEARPSVNFAAYYATTRQLIMALMRQGKHPIYLDEMMGGLGSDAVRHAASVAHLAMVMGLRLEQYIVKQRRLPPDHAREVVNLGVAGMMHDIGKIRLPKHVRDYDAVRAPKSPEEDAAWQAHPVWSYEMIHDSVEASACAAVLHHHQHFDGTGFPAVSPRRGAPRERQQGEEIHIFGRVLQAADLFERLSITASGKRRPNVQVLHMMRTMYGNRIDPHIMRALPSIIPPYPPGATVKLSDGTTATVIEFHPREPYYPTVRRLDRDTWAMTGAPFNILPGAGPSITSVCGMSVGDTTEDAAAGAKTPVEA